MKRVYCFRPTLEDWYGNFKISDDARYGVTKFVCVTYHGNISPYDQTPIYRVSVWGNDDFGFDKDFGEFEESSAFELYLDLCSIEYISAFYCTSREMNRA